MKNRKPSILIVSAALCTIGLLIFPLNVQATNITNTAGKIYFDAELVRVEPHGITLSHTGGLGLQTLPFGARS